MPNDLRGASSPYLLQHADNPVEWMEWGEAAFETARRLDRPILLSIGYSACHWCHVMAHESFEDEAIAAVMNAHFVNVKVDREERPDVDALYMDALQAMTGQGGWPLTVFLTPAGEPFYGGTYFPPTRRHGMVSFPELLEGIAAAWRDRRGDVEAGAARLVEWLAQAAELGGRAEIDRHALDRAAADMLASEDGTHGGFGRQPKFPNATNLGFLLLHAGGTDDPTAMVAVERALDAMAAGGIFDQLGGGFHRYSVDAAWTVPHFEKMLYDNAQLIEVYATAWAVRQTPRWREVVERTAAWALAEMVAADGGFYASQDADTADGEGHFFTWTRAELDAVLGAEEGAIAARHFGVTERGSFERGRSVLTSRSSESEIDPMVLDRIRARLLEARAERQPPSIDTKIIAEWNGLMIGALARASTLMGGAEWLVAARRAADFVLEALALAGGGLAHSWRDGRLGPPAFLEDYFAMARALLALWEADFDVRWLDAAAALAREALELFADPEDGSSVLHRSGPRHERLLVARREIVDGAMPSGNALAADVLWRLGALLDDASMRARATGIVEHTVAAAQRAPLAVGAGLAVGVHLARGVKQVAVFSPGGATDPLLRAVRKGVAPGLVVAWSPEPIATHRVPWLAGRPMPDGRPVAYVCSGMTCGPPIHEPSALARLVLDERTPGWDGPDGSDGPIGPD